MTGVASRPHTDIYIFQLYHSHGRQDSQCCIVLTADIDNTDSSKSAIFHYQPSIYHVIADIYLAPRCIGLVNLTAVGTLLITDISPSHRTRSLALLYGTTLLQPASQ